MKLVRMRTLGAFGLGFLAGSKAGHGPWEKAQESMGQIKEKLNSNGDGDSMSNMSTNDGSTSQRGNQQGSTPTAKLNEM